MEDPLTLFQGIKGHLVSLMSKAIKLLTPFKPHHFTLKVQKYLLTHKVQTLMAPSVITLQFGIYQCLVVLYFLFPATGRSISKPIPAMNRELQ